MSIFGFLIQEQKANFERFEGYVFAQNTELILLHFQAIIDGNVKNHLNFVTSQTLLGRQSNATNTKHISIANNKKSGQLSALTNEQ